MAHSTVRLRTPQDVVLAAPLMLGYWPARSVCALLVDEDGDVVLIARWDCAGGVAVPAGPWPDCGEPAPAAFHVVVYAPEHADDPAPWFAIADGLEANGLPLGHFLLALRSGDEVLWTPALAPDERDVTSAPQPVTEAQIEDRARSWGLPPFVDSRADYVGDIAPEPDRIDGVRRAMPDAQPLSEARRDDAITMVHRLLVEGRPSLPAIAEALHALRDTRVRDTVLWDIAHETPARWPEIADRLVAIVASAPETHVAPAATLLGIVRWQLGDGSRASAAIDRALAAEPAYSLAQLVQRCLVTGMHPGTWREGLADLSREACRRAA